MHFSIFIIPIILAATPYQLQQTDGSVEPRMRKNIPSVILVSNNADTNGNNEKFRWYGADAQQVLRQLQQEMQSRTNENTNSVLNKLKAFFMPTPSVESQKLNNCFFTPINCRVAPTRMFLNGGRAAATMLITDEQKQKLMAQMAQHGHRRKNIKSRA